MCKLWKEGRYTRSTKEGLVPRCSEISDSVVVGGMCMLMITATCTVVRASGKCVEVGAAARSICIGEGRAS